MSNALANITALAPTLFSAAQEVSAEPFGIVDGIYTNFDNKGVAKGDKVTVPVSPVSTAADFTPNNVTPEGVARTEGKVDVEITKSRKSQPVALSGEQIRSLQNGGNFDEWVRQWAAQSMRVLRNEMEKDAAVAIKIGASRATGVSGQTPFASDLSALTAVRKILRDNGAPMADLQFAINSNSELNLLNLGIVQQAYAAGTAEERRRGTLLPQLGFNIRTSAGLDLHTAGSFSSGNGTVVAKATSGAIDHSAGQFLPGDVISLADVAGEYVINSADADADTVAINRPGWLQSGATKAVTLSASYTPNLAFERNAVVGIVRPPLIPDNATIRTFPITDQFGMTYLFVEIQQYGQISWEMHLAWGFKVVQPEHVALLKG
jgi:hypothetical protein